MKSLQYSLLLLAAGLFGCADSAADRAADATRENADATAEAVRENADAVDDAGERKADAIEAQGERKADAIEEGTLPPTPAAPGT